MPHQAHAELSFLQCATIKLLQRFLSTLKATSKAFGADKGLCGSAQNVCWGVIKCLPHFAFILSHFSSVSNICSHNWLPIYSPHYVRGIFVLTAPAHLLESLGSGNDGSDWSLMCHRKLLLSPGSSGLCWTGELPLAGWGTSAPCRKQGQRSCVHPARKSQWLCTPLGSGTGKGQTDRVAAGRVLPTPWLIVLLVSPVWPS